MHKDSKLIFESYLKVVENILTPTQSEEGGKKVNFNKLADHYGVSANDIKKACNESYIKEERHPILDDKDRLEDILNDLQIIAHESDLISKEGKRNLLAASERVAIVADEVQRIISRTNLYPQG